MSHSLPRRVRIACRHIGKQKPPPNLVVQAAAVVGAAAVLAYALTHEAPIVAPQILRLLVGAICLALVAFISLRRRTVSHRESYAEVGLDGILTPLGFLAFDDLVSAEIGPSELSTHASIELLKSDGEKLCLSVLGNGREAVELIAERRDTHKQLTQRAQRVAPDGYRGVRVEDSDAMDLLEAMRETGLDDVEVEGCLARALTADRKLA